MDEPKPTPCGLCGRGFPKADLTRHHCLPKSKGGTSDDVSLICPQCHGMVHATFTNATLAAVYPTIEELRQAPELAGFIRWARKQPVTRRKRNKERRRKV
ncbi:MAG: HNH endonuclease [Gemmataceae bacterium]|nr:HNH endonuclease [Gemmataceae bacterium]